MIDQAEVFGAERVLKGLDQSAVFIKALIRQPAGLGTLSSVSAPASKITAHLTLSRIADTERSVNKNFYLYFRILAYLFYFPKRQFSGQNNSLVAQTSCHLDAAKIVDGTLG